MIKPDESRRHRRKRLGYVGPASLPDPQKHNYMAKVLALQAKHGVPGKVLEFDIAHDNWCAIHKGSYCNCDPNVSVRPPRT